MRVRTGRLKRLRSACQYPKHDAWIHLTPTRPIWFFAVTRTSGFTCCASHDEPRIRASEAYPFRMVRQTYPSAPWALRRRFRPSRPSPQLLWPLLTSRPGFHRRPFRHEARSPQVRTHSFPAQPPDLRRLILDHKSFAVSGPLALIGTAFYPVLVHRLAVSLHASSPRSVTLPQLRFTSLTVVSLREDLHLQEYAHAGRTNKKPLKNERLFISGLPTLVSQRRTYLLSLDSVSALGTTGLRISTFALFFNASMYEYISCCANALAICCCSA
jgi:hypothetical protein